ncbi:hypothetical protein [Corynebacterium uterequi]|uniref:hypothetical protein n=1 Tax=Corynebacterium uterequi TaxID=1072256 RepID=UPI00118759DE|nr:hypothetical protein [Corynebacterium uterequi]
MTKKPLSSPSPTPARAVGALLLSRPLSTADLRELLDEAGLNPGGDGTALAVERGGMHVGLTVIERSLGGDGVLRNIHPISATPPEVEAIVDHRAHVVILAFGSADASVEVHELHAQVVAALADAPEVVGYAIDGTTWSASALRDVVSEQAKLPVELWAPVWAWEGEAGTTAYSYGLSHFGGWEVQVVDAALGVEEAYVVLLELVHRVVTGVRLDDGAVVNTPSGVTARVEAAAWVIDPTMPAWRLVF